MGHVPLEIIFFEGQTFKSKKNQEERFFKKFPYIKHQKQELITTRK